ncbi:MAG: chromosome segregation ATPase [Cyanobacteria bacterium J06638_22]
MVWKSRQQRKTPSGLRTNAAKTPRKAVQRSPRPKPPTVHVGRSRPNIPPEQPADVAATYASRSAVPRHPQTVAEASGMSASVSDTPSPAPKRYPFPGARLFFSWPLWGSLGLIAILGTGGLAAALLFKIPALPNCPEIFWPTASASLRLYCGQLAANKQTVDDLLEAIELVNQLPESHPMRAEVDRSIELWASEILELAEETFHRGDLDGAIAIARRIPTGTAARDEIAERTNYWRTVWREGEEIFAEAEEALLDQNPREAFAIGTRLLDVDNRYWNTVKHQELSDLITASREDGNRLGQIRQLARRGGLSNLLEAIAMAQDIKRISPVYPAAQRLIASLGEDMLDLAENALEREDFAEAMDIVEQIPDSANLQAEIQDFTILAQAQAQSWQGGLGDLDAAIAQAQRIRRNRPLYGRAQALISRWQVEMRDVVQLNYARQLAASGTLIDLRAAVVEARRVPTSNPRGDEARDLAQQWTTRIETIEDQPILSQATALAGIGDLRTAIDVASQIRDGRALHGEAQQQIQSWTNQIQRAEDQPVLDQAQQLAAAGDLTQAIAVAQQIQSGRVLHGEAQSRIQTWQAQITGQNRLRDAQLAASPGSSEARIAGIRIAATVPSNTPSRPEADRLIAIWSQEVLQNAQVLSSYNLDAAIALLQQLPANTPASASAQQQLASWQQLRNASIPNNIETLPAPSPVYAEPVEAEPQPTDEDEKDEADE